MLLKRLLNFQNFLIYNLIKSHCQDIHYIFSSEGAFVRSDSRYEFRKIQINTR